MTAPAPSPVREIPGVVGPLEALLELPAGAPRAVVEDAIARLAAILEG